MTTSAEALVWTPVPLRRAAPPPLGGLEDLAFGPPRAVLRPGEPGRWDDFGVRDPAILVDAAARPVRQDGRLVMYYTGSTEGGQRQATGRAVSEDGGLTWRREPETPVLAPRPGAWDARVAATPWAVAGDDGRVRLYYRGARQAMVDDALGLAVSADGVRFERFGDGPIVTRNDFPLLAGEGPLAMGVVNVARLFDGRWLLAFEVGGRERGMIMAAVSDDGEHFAPFSEDRPLLAPEDLDRNPALRVANPRLIALADAGLYALTFNAHAGSGLFWLGLAFSRDLVHWREHPGNPLLLPSGRPVDDPFSGRLEGGVLLGDALAADPVPLYLMGIPRRGPSHRGAVVGLAEGRRDGPHHGFASVAATDARIAVADDVLTVARGREAVEARAHFRPHGRGGMTAVRCEFRCHGDGEAALVLAPEAAPRDAQPHLAVTWCEGCLFAAAVAPARGRRERLARIFAGRRRRGLGRCPGGVWHRLELRRGGDDWLVRLDDAPPRPISTEALADVALADLSFQSAGATLEVRRIATAGAP